MTIENKEPGDVHAYQQRIRELEARLEESEETLEAIRRGDIDALVVQGSGNEGKIYTLQNADSPYRVLIEQIGEGALTLSEDGTVLYCNQRLADMLSTPQERLIGQNLRDFVLETERGAFGALLRKAWTSVVRDNITLCAQGSKDLPVYVTFSPLNREDGSPMVCGVVADRTEQRQHLHELAQANRRLEAEIVERARAEDALRQSQKMEAVGQLTGGIAHDFNNLLTGIIGSLEMLTTRVAQGRISDVARYVAAAQGAAQRAAALTHRLLAFSRRQTLAPKSTDVNRLVSDMEDLIRRTVGPAITFDVKAAEGSWNTLVDPPQLENALLNLCINARDAMPEGGSLTIATANRSFSEIEARTLELKAGEYLSLCVSDTGTGMPPDVIARAFDPFFTTKPIGLGTGLGLSMIYGFAKQSGGSVKIESAVGHGTRISLYLPRHNGKEERADLPAENGLAGRAGPGETVLVVDDETVVRMLVVDILQDMGFTALEADDGATALGVLESDARIDLLVTDVGLPNGMNGRQLSDAAQALRPGLKVLFITGYADNAALKQGHLGPGTFVMVKPFPMEALAARIKELLAMT